MSAENTASTALAQCHLIVTGATGFLGSAFVRHAVGAGAEVTVTCRADSDQWRLAGVSGRLEVITAAVAELATITISTRARPVMVHFAAAGVNQSVDDVTQMVQTNVAGTAQALLLARRLQVERFVLVGTSGEYGAGVHLPEDAPLRPTSVYGATRAGATMLAQSFGARHGMDVVVVRPFAVFGAYESAYRLIPHAIVSALRGAPIRISTGHQTRDYVYVNDVSAGIASACITPDARNGVFNLCTGRETSVLDAAKLVARLVDGGSQVEAGVMPPIPGEMWRTSGDPSRAQEVLRWSATFDLEAGLVDTISWFRAHGTSMPSYLARSE